MRSERETVALMRVGWMMRAWLLFGMVLAGLAASWASAADAVAETNTVLLPVESDPTISFRIWFRVGSQSDPAGKEGLASLTAAMLTEAATQQNSYEQILERLYPMAASYAATTGVEMTVIEGRVHRDNLGDFYRLLTEAILSPAFRRRTWTGSRATC